MKDASFFENDDVRYAILTDNKVRKLLIEKSACHSVTA